MVIQLIKKNKVNLEEQNTYLYNSVYSESFSYSDGIWKNETLSQSESKCFQTPIVGNIMTTNDIQ